MGSYITYHQNQGFTLVEIIVVIVILTLFASMLALSVGTSDARQNLAFYEHLQSNLAYIRLLSMERMQPMGLAIQLATEHHPNQLVLVKLDNPYVHQVTPPIKKNNMELSVDLQNQTKADWQIDSQFTPLVIPNQVEIQITPLDSLHTSEQLPIWFQSDHAPPIIWFGTGEATPVKIDVVKKNSSDQAVFAVGEPIIVNISGAIGQ